MSTLPPMTELEPAPMQTPSFPAPPHPRIFPSTRHPKQDSQPRPPASITRGDRGTGTLKTARAACEYQIREYVALQRQQQQPPLPIQQPGPSRYGNDPVAEARLWSQRDVVLAELYTLKSDVAAVVKSHEAHRFGRWVLGGFIASLIPAIRRIFRRPPDDTVSSTDTEHAFRRSRSLIERILSTVRNNGALASAALLVLSVLYVFQSEVSLRVAKTVSKRLKRLSAKVERGVEPLDDRDLAVFGGWRWRVLLWKG